MPGARIFIPARSSTVSIWRFVSIWRKPWNAGPTTRKPASCAIELKNFLADRAAPDAEEVIDIVIDISHAFNIRRRVERAEDAHAFIHAFENAALHLLDHLVDRAEMRVREQLDRDSIPHTALELLGEDFHRLGVAGLRRCRRRRCGWTLAPGLRQLRKGRQAKR